MTRTIDGLAYEFYQKGITDASGINSKISATSDSGTPSYVTGSINTREDQ